MPLAPGGSATLPWDVAGQYRVQVDVLVFGPNSADALHTLIEATKLACADMVRHVCDPCFHEVPIEAMLSKSYAAGRAIDPARANPAVLHRDVPVSGGDTTYLRVVDRDGNMVSLNQQSVMRDKMSRVNYGASDPRNDGAAIPEPTF